MFIEKAQDIQKVFKVTPLFNSFLLFITDTITINIHTKLTTYTIQKAIFYLKLIATTNLHYNSSVTFTTSLGQVFQNTPKATRHIPKRSVHLIYLPSKRWYLCQLVQNGRNHNTLLSHCTDKYRRWTTPCAICQWQTPGVIPSGWYY